MGNQVITPEGLFWRHISGSSPCPVCACHEWVIVQRVGTYYCLHTQVAKLDDYARCIHTWRARRDDPPCLAAFEPTELVPKLLIDSGKLMSLLRMYRSGDITDMTF